MSPSRARVKQLLILLALLLRSVGATNQALPAGFGVNVLAAPELAPILKTPTLSALAILPNIPGSTVGPARFATTRGLTETAHALTPHLAAISDPNASNESSGACARSAFNLLTNERSQPSIDGVLASPAVGADLLTRLGLRERILAGAGIKLGPNGRPLPVEEPIHAAAFDNDDNIAYYRTNIYVRHKVTHKEIAIPTAKFAEVRPYIGTSGDYKDYEFFDLNEPYGGSFRDFLDIVNPDIFPHDVLEAITGVPANMWRGPSWFAFATGLRNPKTAPWVAIITSRAHQPANFVRGFDVLSHKDLLARSPRQEMMFGVGVGSQIQKSLPPSMATPERKFEVITSLLDLIESIPLANPGDRHTFGFSDDDVDMITRVRDHLSVEVAKGRWPHVRISLFSTGPGHESVEGLDAPAAK